MPNQRGRKRSAEPKPGSFGEKLQNLRKARDYTVEDMAEKTGLSRNYITRLESGKSSPSARVVRDLAGALDELPLVLKMAAGLVEFWDLYPVNLKERPKEESLTEPKLSDDEETKLLWFLHYVRTTGA